MTSTELQDFCQELLDKNITQIPSGFVATITDFEQFVPEQYHNSIPLEYNYRSNTDDKNKFIKIYISKPTEQK